ncbi:3-deoxy-manno-octulosonate cytidylyltransferase [compost metagenome]
MKTVAIIQARMSSTRLPGKVMRMLEDRTVVGHVITRCLAIPSVDEIVIATTDQEEDIVVVDEAERYGVSCYRGSLDNVLDRYYRAAVNARADVVVRITSDCPLLDPRVSDRVITHFLQHKFDYSSSGQSSTFPRGLDTEVFTFNALKTAHEKASHDYEYEHVTPYLYMHPDEFNTFGYRNTEDCSKYRLTLDTLEDWELISAIYKELYKGQIFYWEEVKSLLLAQPELALINSHIVQKKLGE